MTRGKNIEQKKVKERSRVNGEDEEGEIGWVTRFLSHQRCDEVHFTKVRGHPSVVVSLASSYLFVVPLLPTLFRRRQFVADRDTRVEGNDACGGREEVEGV